MTDAQIHLIFNHFPLVIFLISTLILAYGVFKNNTLLIRTGFVLNILGFLFILPIYFSGEGAEELVEHMDHVSHDFIHEHEDVAEIAFVGSIFLVLFSLAGLFNVPRRFTNILPKAILIATIISFFLMAYTAHLGGRVSHPELREGFKPGEDHLEEVH